MLKPSSFFFKLEGVSIPFIKDGENSLTYSQSTDYTFQQIIGAANEFKEGDLSVGVGAEDSKSRENAKILLERTDIETFYSQPMIEDSLTELIWNELDMEIFNSIKDMTILELKNFVLTKPEEEIKGIIRGLLPSVISSVVKVMTNEELGQLAKRINTENIGRKNEAGCVGYLGARIQPNSPDDSPDEILMQVMNGFSYAVGDVILGTNPVDSSIESIFAIENQLKDVVTSFESFYDIEELVPWCVLSHIDDQFKVEEKYPGSTKIFFQSLAGTEEALKTFGLTVEKLLFYAKYRKELNNGYSFYFETGQGGDFTNGAGAGADMVWHEARKHTLARILFEKAGQSWMIINDVAGFIGPEVFREKDQLLRCTLEDIAIGKLNGLTVGLDICSTLHMDVSLTDLENIQDDVCQLSSPGYIMALPTRNDPMLNYLTTSFCDHLRLRNKNDLKISPKMENFFKKIKILNSDGTPNLAIDPLFGKIFGNPKYVYYKYLEAKGDERFTNLEMSNEERVESIYAEAEALINKANDRNVFICEIPDEVTEEYWKMDPNLEKKVETLFNDAKKSVWTEFDYPGSFPTFTKKSEPKDGILYLESKSESRKDYVLHPTTGEELNQESINNLKEIQSIIENDGKNVVLIISDGLNPFAITDDNHIIPFIEELKELLNNDPRFQLCETYIVTKNGRVRTGYKVGSQIFQNFDDEKGTIISIIGERPGSGHHAFSAYVSLSKGNKWNEMDHSESKLIAGISDTGLDPKLAAKNVLLLLDELYIDTN